MNNKREEELLSVLKQGTIVEIFDIEGFVRDISIYGKACVYGHCTLGDHIEDYSSDTSHGELDPTTKQVKFYSLQHNRIIYLTYYFLLSPGSHKVIS